MANYKLLIDGKEVDLKSPEVKHNKQINGLDQFDSREVDVSEVFELSNTHRNNVVLGFLNLHNSGSEAAKIKLPAVLMVDSAEVFSGLCKIIDVLETGTRGYKVRLISEVKSMKDTLSGTSLKSLNYSSINHSKTSTIVNSRIRNTINVGYTYAIFDPYLYEQDGVSRNIQAFSVGDLGYRDFQTLRIQQNRDYRTVCNMEFNEMQPVLYLSWIIDKISDLVDKNFTGSIFSDNFYLTEVRTLNKAVIEHPRFNYFPNGVPVDSTPVFVNFADLVHDIDLWTIFKDFLISYGLVFTETDTSIHFTKINDLVNTSEDWNKHFISSGKGRFDVPKFGQKSWFRYALNPVTENLLENLEQIDFNTFYANGYHTNPYEFSVNIFNQNIPLEADIYISKFQNQFDRIYSLPSEPQYNGQRFVPFPVVPYTNRSCSRTDGELYYSDLHNVFESDLEVPINSVTQLISYTQMFNAVNNDNVSNSVAESTVKAFYESIQGNAPLLKYRVNQISTRLGLSNILNTSSGSFPNNPYSSTLDVSPLNTNILTPVNLKDTQGNNLAWFNMMSNYKQFDFMLNFSLKDFVTLDLSTAKVLDGSLWYVSKVEKYVEGRPTRVKMIKIS